MTRLTAEPASIRSMDELLAVALAMEKESAARYADLAGRMRAAGRADMAAVFERLVREETGHIDTVLAWSRDLGRPIPDTGGAVAAPPGVFDDESIGLISPELVDAYRSLAIAVRNEERAFAFWSYVAAGAASPEVRVAAEGMAREELGHAKTLRAERRRAFRVRAPDAGAQVLDFAALEAEVAALLDARARAAGGKRAHRELAEEARRLSHGLAAAPLQEPMAPAARAPKSLDALCEWLADCYIDAGENLASQAARDRAQEMATAAVRRLALVRDLDGR